MKTLDYIIGLVMMMSMRHSGVSLAITLGLLTVTSSALLAARQITIVALGDSTTAGTPFFKSPLESPPDGTGDPEGQFAYWMMRRHPEWKVLNKGIDGQRTDEIRARFSDAIADGNPRYVIILAGVNDVYQGTPLQEAADNLIWMWGQAEANNIVPIAATIPTFDRATPQQLLDIKALNTLIRKAADHRHIPLAELHDAVADPANPSKLMGSPDGLHPDIGGYRKMGVELTKVIEEMEAARPR